MRWSPGRTRSYAPTRRHLVAALLWLGGPVLEWRVGRLRARASSVGETRVVARLLVALRRFEDADAIVGTGLATFRDHPDLLTQHAFSAHESGRHAEALARWKRRLDVGPETPLPWWGVAANASKLSKLDEATATIQEALERFPDDPLVIREAARIADQRHDYSQAVTYWRRMLDFRNVEPEARQRYTYNLITLGRFQEAEAELDRARRIHPGHLGLSVNAGILAAARGEWTSAIAILSDFRARFPDDAAARDLLGRATMLRNFALVEEARPTPVAPAPVEIVRFEDDAVRTMLLGFESIGTDCEFGLVQRRYGAEPLGLLRWNTTSPEGLLLGLASRFEGLGDREHTQLSVLPESGEYYVSDHRLDLQMHTFVFEGQVEKDQLLPKMCRRLRYLRGKLIEDLTSAEKVCIYKCGDSGPDFIRDLHDSLRCYGPVRLLCVREASSDAAFLPFRGEAGEVHRVDEDLYVGFLSRLGGRDGVWDIAYDDWVSMCRTLAGARELPAGPGAPAGAVARPFP